MMEFITNIDFLNKSTTAYSHIIWSMSVAGFIVLYMLITRVKLRITRLLTKNSREKIKVYLSILNNPDLYNEHDIKENFDSLYTCTQKSTYLAQYMLDQLIDIKNNLRIPMPVLKQLSENLNLRKVALTKLMEGDVELVLKGINELKIVGGNEDAYFVQGFLCHYDREVRRAARITIALLKPQEALFSFNSLMDELDSYERTCLLNSLKKLPFHQVPDFSIFFDSAEESALCFSIEMAGKFNQKWAVPQIKKFIAHSSPVVNTCAMEALRLLEDSQSIDLVQYMEPLKISFKKSI